MDNSSSCSSIKIQFNAASPPPPMVISHFSKAPDSKMLIAAKSKDAKSNLNSTDAKLAPQKNTNLAFPKQQ